MQPIRIARIKGIPAINEIVTFITGILPAPVKIILAVLLVTTIASFVMPAILNLFGYACVEEQGDLELYQIPMSSLVQKTVIDISRGFSEVFLGTEYQLPDDPFPDGDRTYLRIPDECFLQTNYNGSTIWGYTALCTDCSATGGFLWWKDGEVCLDDGIRNDFTIKTGYCQKCSPPDPYYYNHSYCTNPANQNCFFTISDPALIPSITDDFGDAIYLDRVLKLNGVKRAQDDTEFANIQCQDVGKPNLYFFNIEVFNRTLWVYIVIASALIGFAFSYYAVML